MVDGEGGGGGVAGVGGWGLGVGWIATDADRNNSGPARKVLGNGDILL